MGTVSDVVDFGRGRFRMWSNSAQFESGRRAYTYTNTNKKVIKVTKTKNHIPPNLPTCDRSYPIKCIMSHKLLEGRFRDVR